MNRKTILLLVSIITVISILLIIAIVQSFKYGTLVIESKDENLKNITIYIDNKEAQTITLPYSLKLKGGKHTIRVLTEGLERFENYEVDIEANKTVHLVIGSIYNAEEVEATEKFFKKNPLLKLLPYKTNYFSIDFDQNLETLEITYKVNIKAAIDTPKYEQYKKEALIWIRGKGVDPNSLKIIWSP